MCDDQESLVDFSDDIDPFDMPLCPICDQPMLSYEALCMIKAHDSIALAHVVCVGLRREELGI